MLFKHVSVIYNDPDLFRFGRNDSGYPASPEAATPGVTSMIFINDSFSTPSTPMPSLQSFSRTPSITTRVTETLLRKSSKAKQSLANAVSTFQEQLSLKVSNQTGPEFMRLQSALLEYRPRTDSREISKSLLSLLKASDLDPKVEFKLQAELTQCIEDARNDIQECYKKALSSPPDIATLLRVTQNELEKAGVTDFKKEIESLKRNIQELETAIEKSLTGEAKRQALISLKLEKWEELKSTLPQEASKIETLEKYSISTLIDDLSRRNTLLQSFNRSSSTDSRTPLETSIQNLRQGRQDSIEHDLAPDQATQIATAVLCVATQNVHIEANQMLPQCRLGDFKLVREDIDGIMKQDKLSQKQKAAYRKMENTLFEQMGTRKAFEVPSQELEAIIANLLTHPIHLSVCSTLFGENKTNQEYGKDFVNLFKQGFNLLDLDTSKLSTVSWSATINKIYLLAVAARNSSIEFRPLQSPAHEDCKKLVELGMQTDDLYFFCENPKGMDLFDISNQEALKAKTPKEMLETIRSATPTDEEYPEQALVRIAKALHHFHTQGLRLTPDPEHASDPKELLSAHIEMLYALNGRIQIGDESFQDTQSFLEEHKIAFPGVLQHDGKHVTTGAAMAFNPETFKFEPNPNMRKINKDDYPDWQNAASKVSMMELSMLVNLGWRAELAIDQTSGKAKMIFHPPLNTIEV